MPEESAPVSRTSLRTANGRKTREVNRAVVVDIDRLRRDAGMSVRRMAHEASIDSGYLSQLFAGLRSPSTAVLVALTTVLGADLSIRVYPTTGPTVRDAIQARIGEELLRIAAPLGGDRSRYPSIARPVGSSTSCSTSPFNRSRSLRRSSRESTAWSNRSVGLRTRRNHCRPRICGGSSARSARSAGCSFSGPPRRPEPSLGASLDPRGGLPGAD